MKEFFLVLFAGTFLGGVVFGRSLRKSKKYEIKLESYINKWGYRVLVREVLEHRHQAELVLGRFLMKSEVVHHINGNRLDNRLENLCVMERVKHEQLHAWLHWIKEKKGRYPDQKEMLGVLDQYGTRPLKKDGKISP